VEDRDLSYADGHLQSGAKLECKILIMDGLQHVVLVLLVPLAWPGLDWKRRIAGLAFAIPVLCFVEFADLPWTIVGDLDTAKAELTSSSSSSVAMIWREILATGGRLALGLAGGLLAYGFTRSRLSPSNSVWQSEPLRRHDLTAGADMRRQEGSHSKRNPLRGSAK
jgi:hypothetical protein